MIKHDLIFQCVQISNHLTISFFMQHKATNSIIHGAFDFSSDETLQRWMEEGKCTKEESEHLWNRFGLADPYFVHHDLKETVDDFSSKHQQHLVQFHPEYGKAVIPTSRCDTLCDSIQWNWEECGLQIGRCLVTPWLLCGDTKSKYGCFACVMFMKTNNGLFCTRGRWKYCCCAGVMYGSNNCTCHPLGFCDNDSFCLICFAHLNMRKKNDLCWIGPYVETDHMCCFCGYKVQHKETDVSLVPDDLEEQYHETALNLKAKRAHCSYKTCSFLGCHLANYSHEYGPSVQTMTNEEIVDAHNKLQGV